MFLYVRFKVWTTWPLYMKYELSITSQIMPKQIIFKFPKTLKKQSGLAKLWVEGARTVAYRRVMKWYGMVLDWKNVQYCLR
jgi:hypothetical protein